MVDALIWQVKCLSRVPESGVLTRLSLSFPKSSDIVEPFCVLTVSSCLAALSHKLPQGPTAGDEDLQERGPQTQQVRND